MSDKPPEQRPELPDFWDKRFREGVTPWDAGRVPENLRRFAAAQAAPLNTLIPGCGSAWDAAHLAGLGWPVTALDFSAAAIAAAREVLGDWPGGLVCADFFAYEPAAPLDLIYERAFLCALPRKLWPAWGERMAQLLPAGGRLAGFFFFRDEPKGPPFGIRPEQLEALLTPNFELVEEAGVEDSIPVFAGDERWQVWRRR
ncbi:MAG TPA: methyltransferase [Rhodocyclaceae bacterium]|nr:methyltransferase [Rhodocyclaceae bacterium]